VSFRVREKLRASETRLLESRQKSNALTSGLSRLRKLRAGIVKAGMGAHRIAVFLGGKRIFLAQGLASNALSVKPLMTGIVMLASYSAVFLLNDFGSDGDSLLLRIFGRNRRSGGFCQRCRLGNNDFFHGSGKSYSQVTHRLLKTLNGTSILKSLDSTKRARERIFLIMEQKAVTKVWSVDNDVENAVEKWRSCTQIVDAARLLRDGEVVAFPTETVYGLGANALSNAAVEKIFAAKGRPSDNPLIVHIAKREQLSTVAAEVPAKAERLMETFWPGPLTIILPRTDRVASLVTAGLDSVGVRMPDHAIAQALIAEAGVPIAAPSANRSGRPSPTTAAHVLADLEGRVAGVVDGGATGVGLESTVIDVTVEPPVILRPGGITREQLEEVIGPVALDPSFAAGATETPRAPGMKYTHYAPEGEMWLVAGEAGRVREKMAAMLREAKQRGRKTGVLATDETCDYWRGRPDADIVLSVGSRADLGEVARQLYAVLRDFDAHRAQFIVAETFSRDGLGMAVMNRLEKAAGGRIQQA